MKFKISAVIALFLAVLSMFGFKGFFGNIITDKTGMVRYPEDDIILCRYTSGGGMDGSWETLEIRKSENGGAVVVYEYSSLTSDKELSESAEVSFEALSEIRAICRKYEIFSWGELKDCDDFLLDAPTTTVFVSTGDISYSYNSNQEIPEKAYGITTELYNVMYNYLKGVD